MHRLIGVLSSSLFASSVLLMILVLQIRLLWKNPAVDNGAAAQRAEELVAKAESEFRQGHETPAIALISAALLADPDNDKALDSYRNRLRTKLDAGLKEHDWELCELQVTAYDAVVRTALRGAESIEAVNSIIRRQDEIARWESDVSRTRNEVIAREVDELEAALSKADQETLASLDARLRQISPEYLGDPLRERVAVLAVKFEEHEQAALRAKLKAELAEMKAAAETAELPIQKLQELRVVGEHLHAKIVEAKLQGADLAADQAACQDLLSQIDQRLQVLSVRQMQTIADADAKRAITDARSVLEAVEKSTELKTGQARGAKLAEAEIGLNQIDRLCSTACQIEASQLLETVRRRALGLRTQQTREYNLWAIQMLEESIGDFARAKGWFNDDEEAFKKVLGEKVGRIDPQFLHPVTYSLFADMFQKFLSELDASDKVAVTRVVEEMPRRPLSDF